MDELKIKIEETERLISQGRVNHDTRQFLYGKLQGLRLAQAIFEREREVAA